MGQLIRHIARAHLRNKNSHADENSTNKISANIILTKSVIIYENLFERQISTVWSFYPILSCFPFLVLPFLLFSTLLRKQPGQHFLLTDWKNSATKRLIEAPSKGISPTLSFNTLDRNTHARFTCAIAYWVESNSLFDATTLPLVNFDLK